MKLDLEAAKDATIPDVLPPPGAPFRVLFVGINPGLYSAATGWHFARPGNRFWPALHASGFTPRLLKPSRAAGADRLRPRHHEHRPPRDRPGRRADRRRAQGRRRSACEALVAARRPGYVAILGVTAYRTAFARPKAAHRPPARPPGHRPPVDPPEPQRPQRLLAAPAPGGSLPRAQNGGR